VRAPGGAFGDVNSRGPRLPQRSCPQSPLRLVQRYSKRSPLTVLLRPQVEIIRATVKQGTSFDFVFAGEKP
jgi:hypothetical protein